MQRLMIVSTFLVLVCLTSTSCSTDDHTTTEQFTDTDSIAIEGGFIKNSDNEVRTYLGIPYAAPPVGHLRWKPPQPVTSWTTTKVANSPGPACIQPSRDPRSLFPDPFEERSEDCLYLNVWTTAKKDEGRPVMVWFHGGGWNTGSGMSYSPDGQALARKGIVLVSVNYRLGVFGFLAHPELTAESPNNASGNYGFLDQQAALQWIQKNITVFGGNPDNVTIFGESAGSWSVNVLVASPLSKELFHKGIGQSGGRFEPAPHLTDERYGLPSGEQRGLDFAEAVGASSLANLRMMTPDDLLQERFRGQEVIDGWVLPQDVRTIFEEGRQNHVPVIVGSNGSEATALVNPAWPTTLTDYRTYVRNEYGDHSQSFNAVYPVENVDDIPAAMYGSRRDARFALPMRSWARATEKTGLANAYLYEFSYIPPHPWSQELGAYHTAEIPYVFDHLTVSRVSASWYLRKPDYQLAKTMSGYWVNFATTGNPNGSGLPEWKPYNLETEPYLDFGSKVTLLYKLRTQQLDFFENHQKYRYGLN